MTDPKPTTAEERAEWAAQHYENSAGRCCAQKWPCAMARLLADLERAEAERDHFKRQADRLALGASSYLDRAIAAEADLARARERIGELEAVLRDNERARRWRYCWHLMGEDCTVPHCVESREARDRVDAYYAALSTSSGGDNG